MRLFTLLDKLTDTVMNGVYPVGSILITTNSANPGTYLPGTWVAYATGKTLIGVNPEDDDFSTEGKTGGSKDAVVVSHTHTMQNGGAHSHQGYRTSFKESGSGSTHYSASGSSTWNATVSAGSHKHTIDSEGTSGSKANLPPYITAYMWRRTE